MFGITDLSFDFLTGYPFLTVLILMLLLLFSVYLYRRTNPPLSRGTRILLAGLRIVAVLALFLALFEPVLSYKRVYQRKPRLTLLVDKSKSMEVVEVGKSRLDRIDSLISSGRFQGLSNHFDVSIEQFAGSLLGNDKSLNIDKTALGEVLRDLADKEISQPSEGWMLFSDGISNSGISAIEAASRLKTPIYSIGVGMETSEKDVAVGGLDYNQVVFAGKPTEVMVHLEWQGMRNEKARIEIRSGEKVLTVKTIHLPPGNLKEDVELKFAPEKPGQQAFKVIVPGFKEEISLDNNSRSFSMTVLKSKMRVLLVSDRLDWEYAFLNRFLSGSESVELTRVVYKEDGGFLSGSFPARQEELNRYDLIVLYDVNLQSLRSCRPLFESFLKDKGGSVLVLLGENYLKSSFPRWLDDYLPFINTRKQSRMLYVKYNGQPVENYLFHPAVGISDNRQGIREGWRNLPPFEALVSTDSIPPNSEILVTADIGAGNVHQPIIACRTSGAGRVLAISASPFWHWAFFGYGFGDNDEEYRRFFDGIVNWLSVKEESDPIRIVPDKNVYTRGERVGFIASVYDLGFRPIAGATGHISLVDETGRDSTISQLIEEGEGRYRAEFDLLPPGRYKYVGVVEKEGKMLKETSGQIAIETFSIEEYQRRPDFSVLSSISRLTGGRFHTLDEADSLFTVIDRDEITVTSQKEIVLWNKIWLLGIFIAALGLEWFIRKRFQLI